MEIDTTPEIEEEVHKSKRNRQENDIEERKCLRFDIFKDFTTAEL